MKQFIAGLFLGATLAYAEAIAEAYVRDRRKKQSLAKIAERLDTEEQRVNADKAARLREIEERGQYGTAPWMSAQDLFLPASIGPIPPNRAPASDYLSEKTGIRPYDRGDANFNEDRKSKYRYVW